MRAFRRLLSLAAGLALAGAPLHAQVDQQEHPPEQIQAYVALIKADQARDKENWKVAVQAYREAMKQYSLLVERYANWHPDIVQYRLTYCANEIASVLQKSGKTEAELLAGPSVRPDDTEAAYRDRFEALLREHEAARAELTRLRQTEALREGAAQKVQDERERTEKDLRRLRLDLTASVNLAERRNEQITDLTKELTVLRKDLSEARQACVLREREQEKISADKTGVEKELAVAQQQLALARQVALDKASQVAEAQQQLAALRKEGEDLQAQVAARDGQVREREDRLKALAEENARLKEQGGGAELIALRQAFDEAGAELEKLRRLRVADEDEGRIRGEELQRLVQEHVRLREQVDGLTAERDALRQKGEAAALELEQQSTALRQAGEQGARERADFEAKQKDLQEQLDQAKREAARLDKELGKARAAEGQAAERLKTVEAELAAGTTRRDQRKELEAQLASAQKRVTQLGEQLKEVSAQAEAAQGAMKEEAAGLRAALEQEKKDHAATRKQLEEVPPADGQAEIAKLQEEAARLQKAREAAEVTLHNQQSTMDRLLQENTRLTRELGTWKEQVDKASSMHEALVKQQEGVKNRLAEVSRQAEECAQKLRKSQEELEAMRKPRESGPADDQASRDAQKLRKQVAALSETIDLKDQELAPLKLEVKRLKENVELLSEQKKELEKQIVRADQAGD